MNLQQGNMVEIALTTETHIFPAVLSARGHLPPEAEAMGVMIRLNYNAIPLKSIMRYEMTRVITEMK